ncbi:MAG: hypothetical protein ACOYK7_03230 [Pirellulales bacterium]
MVVIATVVLALIGAARGAGQGTDADPTPPAPWYGGDGARPVPLPPVDDSFLPASVIEPLESLDPGGTEGNDGLPLPGPPGPGRRRSAPSRGAPVSLGSFWAPAAAVSGQSADLAINAQFARVGMPLARPEEGAPMWLGIGKFGRLELATDAVLPDSGLPVPDTLWLAETGVTHIRPLASGATVGGTLLIGSASDRPFAALRDMTLMAIVFANRPAANGRDDWNASLFYSPTSQLPFPVPGLAYVWRPTPSVEAKLGVPAGLEWTPDDDWSLSLGFTPLVNVTAVLRRQLGGGFSAVALYRTDTETFFLADRTIDEERLYVFNQRVAVGLERVLARGFALEMTADYLFDRSLFQGTSFFAGRTDVVAVAPGAGLTVQLLWRR